MKIINKILRKNKKIHGHEFIQFYEDLILKKLKDGNHTFVEIGSQREAGSTLYLSKLCSDNGHHFITVDLNEETTSFAKKIVEKVSNDFEAVNQAGEDYLKEYSGNLGLVYLDAFDIEGDWHPNNLLEWYKSKGSDLTNENCWKMHLDCAIAIKDKIVSNGFIVFDDVNPVDENGKLILKKVTENHLLWSGKGKTAIPYLLENGYVMLDNKRSACILQKKNN